jgi:predicted nucleotidyltransferase
VLSQDISEYIEELKREFPAISSVWLLGSRANGTGKPESDWDFLVFSNEPIFEAIRNKPKLHRENVDLLLVGNDGEFSKPFGEPKRGSLEAWKWREVYEDSAEYIGRKWIPDEEAAAEGLTGLGDIACLKLRAFRV